MHGSMHSNLLTDKARRGAVGSPSNPKAYRNPRKKKIEEPDSGHTHKPKIHMPHLASELLRDQPDIAKAICSPLLPWAFRSVLGFDKPNEKPLRGSKKQLV